MKLLELKLVFRIRFRVTSTTPNLLWKEITSINLFLGRTATKELLWHAQAMPNHINQRWATLLASRATLCIRDKVGYSIIFELTHHPIFEIKFVLKLPFLKFPYSKLPAPIPGKRPACGPHTARQAPWCGPWAIFEVI